METLKFFKKQFRKRRGRGKEWELHSSNCLEGQSPTSQYYSKPNTHLLKPLDKFFILFRFRQFSLVSYKLLTRDKKLFQKNLKLHTYITSIHNIIVSYIDNIVMLVLRFCNCFKCRTKQIKLIVVIRNQDF